MKKKLFLPIILGLFVSCSQDTDESTSKVSKQITSVYKNGNLFYKINYDKDKFLGYDKFENGTISLKVEISYSLNGENPTRWKYYDSSHTLLKFYTYWFEGDKNLITRRDFYTYDSDSDSYTNMGYAEFDNDFSKSSNNLTGASYYNAYDQFQFKYEVNYTDDLGSSISEYYDTENEKFIVKTWIKDNKKAWDKFLDPFTYQHEHNNISISSTNLNSSITSGYTSTYQYDEDDYPISAQYTDSNGNVDNYIFNWD